MTLGGRRPLGKAVVVDDSGSGARPPDEPAHDPSVDLPRRLDLPDGRAIEVRLVRPDDVDRLIALYAGLDDEDRRRRFFSTYRPDRAFFVDMATVADRGGAGVVVVDRCDPDAIDPPIVAEAGYEMLADGNGEMAIAVDRSWRGWLGPYLMAVLSEVAAARGVRNLEAEILTVNRPMRALTKARGEVFMPGSGWETVRVVFPTSGPAPSWCATDRPKVLVEMRPLALEAIEELAAAGYEVVACAGPAGRAHPCPLLAGGECPLAAEADAIVVAISADEVRDELVAAHEQRHASVPVEIVDRGATPLTCDVLRESVERARDTAR